MNGPTESESQQSRRWPIMVGGGLMILGVIYGIQMIATSFRVNIFLTAETRESERSLIAET